MTMVADDRVATGGRYPLCMTLREDHIKIGEVGRTGDRVWIGGVNGDSDVSLDLTVEGRLSTKSGGSYTRRRVYVEFMVSV
jgi:hypothetical protein